MTKEISLRPYQEIFINKIRNKFKRNFKRVVGVAPCGAGKTIIAGWMIRKSLENKFCSLFLVHRKELIDQTAETFERLNIPFGIISAGVKPSYTLPVQIASVQTLVNRLNEIEPPTFIICDECHHILADTYTHVINRYSDAFLLGLTATPVRLDGRGLGNIFQEMVFGPEVNELIREKALSPYTFCGEPLKSINIDQLLGLVEDDKGDYKKSPLSKLMRGEKISNEIVRKYLEHASGLKGICYCVDIAHSKELADTFQRQGIKAVQIDGTTPRAERAQIIREFRAGYYKILCNAELFGEGFDVPDCQCVILARPTKSVGLYIQQAMRPMRIDPNNPDKVARIIDCVKNCEVHGDIKAYRDWSLEDRKKQCPQCGKWIPCYVAKCPHCGYEWEEKKKIIQVVSGKKSDEEEQYHMGELEERFNDGAEPSFQFKLEYLMSVAKERHYQRGWVYRKIQRFIRLYKELKLVQVKLGYERGWVYYQAKELGIKIPPKKKLKKNSRLGKM